MHFYCFYRWESLSSDKGHLENNHLSPNLCQTFRVKKGRKEENPRQAGFARGACGSCYFELAFPIFTHWQATGKNSWRCREFSREVLRLHCEAGAKHARVYIRVTVRSAWCHTQTDCEEQRGRAGSHPCASGRSVPVGLVRGMLG